MNKRSVNEATFDMVIYADIVREAYKKEDWEKCVNSSIALYRRAEELLKEFGVNADDPTEEEIKELTDKGWTYTPRSVNEDGNRDEDDWFWPNGECGWGYTYKEAVEEQKRREQQ